MKYVVYTPGKYLTLAENKLFYSNIGKPTKFPSEKQARKAIANHIKILNDEYNIHENEHYYKIESEDVLIIKNIIE